MEFRLSCLVPQSLHTSAIHRHTPVEGGGGWCRWGVGEGFGGGGGGVGGAGGVSIVALNPKT